MYFICNNYINVKCDPAEIKPAQCCIKLVFHLSCTVMHGSTKLKFVCGTFVQKCKKYDGSNLTFGLD